MRLIVYRKHFFMVGTTFLLLLANAHLAFGHPWWKWHWDKQTIGVGIWNCFEDAEAARNDWDAPTDLSLPTSSVHTDISVWCDDFGNTGWGGLASIEHASFDFWHCFWWCRVEHGHARFNSYYSGSTGGGVNSDRRGVLCQEIGHVLGLDHSDTGDCMGKGYFNNINVTGPHNWNDINAMY
jgi:predicted Zn-dependent protease